MALDYMDFEDILHNTITIDEYAAKMGDDGDIVTLTFMIDSQIAAKDLVTWLERGYQFILDASVSTGEVEPGKWLVFAELERRRKSPERIFRLLNDLETLSGYKLEDWEIEVAGVRVEPTQHGLASQMILSPHKYRVEKELIDADDGLLEGYKTIAGLDPTTKTKIYDEDIGHLKSIAGL